MKLILDRIEKNQNGEKIAVFECGDTFYYINEANMPQNALLKISVGDIIEADLKEDRILSLTVLSKETEKKQEEMSSRLKSLFNRGKK